MDKHNKEPEIRSVFTSAWNGFPFYSLYDHSNIFARASYKNRFSKNEKECWEERFKGYGIIGGMEWLEVDWIESGSRAPTPKEDIFSFLMGQMVQDL